MTIPQQYFTHVDNCDFFFNSQLTTPTSTASLAFGEAQHEGVPFVLIHRGDATLRQLVTALDILVMNEGTLDQSIFNDLLEYDLLFGRRIPVEGDHEGIVLRSGRVGVSFQSLREANSKNLALTTALGDLETHVQSTFGEGTARLDKIGLVIRPCGRVEAQLEHVDGKCSDAGKSRSKSVLIPLRQQRSTLFVGARTLSEIMSGCLSCPYLEPGDAASLDADKCVHQGYCSGRTPIGDMFSLCIFASLMYSRARSHKSSTYAKEIDQIGCLPHDVMKHGVPVPPVVSCVCCDRDIVNRVPQRMQICSLCADVNVRSLGVVCDACTRWLCEPLPREQQLRLQELAQSSKLLRFMSYSLFDEFGQTRLCNHPTSSRVPLDSRYRVRLYFSDNELRNAARWVIRLHTCNLLEASIEGETGIGDDLKRIGEQLLGPCERLSWLTKLMLSFAGIFYVFSDDYPSNSLFFNAETLEDYIRGRKMKLSELVEFCSSPTADMYDLIGRPLNAMLTSNPFELRTRCSCVGIEERSCDASFDSIPTIPSTSTSWNQKYSMAMTNVKSAYYMKCGVEL